MTGGFYDYNLFVKRLKQGHKWEEIVAGEIRKLGLSVDVKPLEICKDRDSRDSARFQNQADIVINEKYIVEVKSNKYSYTGPKDFPFEEAWVDTVQGWNKKNPAPIGVLFVGRKSGGIVFIPGNSRYWWKEKDHFYEEEKIWDKVYTCPKFFLKSLEFLKWYVDNFEVMKNALATGIRQQ